MNYPPWIHPRLLADSATGLSAFPAHELVMEEGARGAGLSPAQAKTVCKAFDDS